MSTLIISKFTPEEMAKHFKVAQDVQSYFKSLAQDKIKYQSETMKIYADKGEDQTALSRDLAEKERLERDIPDHRRFVDETHPENPKRKKMEHELYLMERELERLKDRLSNSTPYNLTTETLHIEKNNMLIDRIDSVVDHVGAWFEEGHIGPGTVDFNGKIFKAE